MHKDELVTQIEKRLGKRILKADRKSPKRFYIEVDAKDIVEIARYLFKEEGLRFNIASALDELGCLEILYHFSHDAASIIVTVRVRLPDRRKAKSVVLASPEHEAEVKLPFEQQASFVGFTVPRVGVYEIAVVVME